MREGEKVMITLKFAAFPAICAWMSFVISDFALASDANITIIKYVLYIVVYFTVYGFCVATGMFM